MEIISKCGVHLKHHTFTLNLLGDLGESDDNVEKLCWGTGEESRQDIEKDGFVGKVIGGDETSTVEHNLSEDDDTPEPLALLAVHAAMHMLFLPQFTCDFYEESEDIDDDSVSSKNESEKNQNKEDKAMALEVGLNEAQYAQHGIPLKPKPACILWAPGCGVKKLKVRFNIYFVLDS